MSMTSPNGISVGQSQPKSKTQVMMKSPTKTKEQIVKEQAKEDIKSIILDIQDDPELKTKINQRLERYKGFTTMELAQTVPNLERTIASYDEAMQVTTQELIVTDEKLQSANHRISLMSKELSEGSQEKIDKATAIYDEQVRQNKEQTKSDICNRLRRRYQQSKALTE
jgi:hypothetical protein